MHFPQPEAKAGDRVHVRGQPWVVARVTAFDTCALVALRGTGSQNRGDESQVLSPFDRIDPQRVVRRLRNVSTRTWRRRCVDLVADTGGPAILRSALAARMDLLPHQLEPAMAIVRGQASRVLIADEVGLGKTVQAGLLITELMGRGAAARVLILCPAGLRDQWTAECRDRFALDVHAMDATSLRRLRRTLPAGVNPWSAQPLVVASMDFVKRPEVLAALRQSHWDIVIVDEAHHAAAGSDRHDAVAAIGRSAPYVVLLTATPHNGDMRAFASLCAIGQHGDSLLTFRRTRHDIGARDDRRVHRLHTQTTDRERRMHRCLADFARAVGTEARGQRSNKRDTGIEPAAAALAIATLRKRALSSAFALARSVERRLVALAGHAVQPFEQLTLPLSDDDGGRGGLEAADEPPEWTIPALADSTQERTLLTRLLDAARRALEGESKLRALERLVRRAREPVLIFTEYRDTLLHVRDRVAPGAAVIHGGLTAGERRRSLEQFAAGGVLLATDAAGEGLNLQQRCRVVVNLELPWSPVRLEQRIGRVDRIGQRRRVHVFHLIAAGTGEGGMLTRLTGKVARANAEIAAANPLESRGAANGVRDGGGVRRVSEAATREAVRLEQARQLLRAVGRGAARSGASIAAGQGVTFIARSRRGLVRAALQGRALVVVRTAWTDRTGRVAVVELTPLLVRVACARRLTLQDLAALESTVSAASADAAADHRAFWAAKIRRERALARATAANNSALRQRGLFDLRADRVFDLEVRIRRDARRAVAERIRAARHSMRLDTSVQAVLVLVP